MSWDGGKSGRVVSWEVWKGGKVVSWGGGRGGMGVRWQVGKAERVARWQGGKGGRAVGWQGGGEGGRFLVLFKGGGYRVSPRFHLIVSDVNQRNEEAVWVQDFLAWPLGWKNSSYRSYANCGKYNGM